MHAHRGRARGLVGVLALSLVVGACGSDSGAESTKQAGTGSTPEASTKLRIQYSVGFTGVLPLLIAADHGDFENNGIDAEFVATNEAVKPLLSGDADVGTPSPIVAAVAASQGQPVRLVMSVQNRITQSLVATPEVAKTLEPAAGDWKKVMEGLRGKKVGVTVRGGSPDLNLRFMLKQAGLEPDKDVVVLPLGNGPGQVGGLKSKRVDAILTFTPLTQQLQLDATGVPVLDLSKPGQAPPELEQPFVTAAMTAKYIADNPDVVERFVKAMTESMDFIKDPANKAQVQELVIKRLEGIEPDVAGQVADELAATMSPEISPDVIEKVNAVLSANDVLEKPVTAADLLATTH